MRFRDEFEGPLLLMMFVSRAINFLQPCRLSCVCVVS